MRKIKILCTLVILALVINFQTCFAATDAEITASVKSQMNTYWSSLTGTVTESTLNSVNGLKSTVNQMSDYEKKEELMEELNKLITAVEDIVSGDDLDNIEDAIEMKFENGELKLALPDTYGRYIYNVVISNAESGASIVSKTARGNDSITLPTLKKETELEYKVSVIYNSEVKKEIVDTYDFEDSDEPEISAIYVLNKTLYVVATDNYKMAAKPYIYSIIKENGYKDEDSIEESDEASFEIDKYPTTVEVQVVDLFGNIASEEVDVTKETEILSGEVSSTIQKKIDSAEKSTVKKESKFRNIAIGEYGKKLYYTDVFDTLFKKEFGSSYDKDNVELTGSDGLDYDDENQTVTLEESGVFELTFEYAAKEKEVSAYVAVGDSNNKIIDYYSSIENNLPFYTTEDSLSITDYITLVTKSIYKNKEDDISQDYIRIIANDKVYSMDDDMEFANEGIIKIYVYNIASGEVKDHNLFYKKLGTTTETLNDVKGHWAEDYIVDMVEEGVISGYEDNTFRPNSRVTVKEFIVMLNRLDPNTPRKTVNPYDVMIGSDDWAYYETRNVLSKIDYSNLARARLMEKYNTPITREEVAFLLNAYFNPKVESTDAYFTDIIKSNYAAELRNLVAYDILEGYNDKTIRPFGFLTRAEAVTILSRASSEF